MLKKDLWLKCAMSISKKETVQLVYYLPTLQFLSYITEYKIGGKRRVIKQMYLFPHTCTTGGVNYHNLKITFTSTYVYIPFIFILPSLNNS